MFQLMCPRERRQPLYTYLIFTKMSVLAVLFYKRSRNNTYNHPNSLKSNFSRFTLSDSRPLDYVNGSEIF